MMRAFTAIVFLVAAASPTHAVRQNVVVVFDTEKGAIEMEVDGVHAPVTAANFLKYVDAGFYDGGSVNRAVRPDNTVRHDVEIQVIQFQIDPARRRDQFPPIPIERTSVTGLRHVDGALSMARSSPDTATASFSIVIGDQPEMNFGGRRNADGQGFAVFGRVTRGMDVVKAIQASPTGSGGPYGTESLMPPIRILKAYRKERSPAAIRAAYVDGLAAYKAKDYATYLAKMAEVTALRPTHPIFLNRLAGAYALNGRIAEAAATLQRLVALNLSHDIQTDPDFAAVKDDRRIASVAAALRAIAQRRIGEAEIAFTIPDRTIIPEGIAYDETSRSFFVSSQYQRKIVRIDARGAVSDFITPRQDGIWMVFGIAVDAPRRRLWAVSTAEPEMSGFAPADEGRAGLFAFDLATGKLLKKIVVDPAERANYFDDLTVARDGRVFVSSGSAGSILTLAPDGEQLSVLVAPGTIQGPNGLALSPDNTRLYVSDYAGAIVLIDPRSGSTRRVTPPADATIYGIDGLTWADGSLIGVENGVEPARVVRLILSADGTRIDRVEILEMNHPKFAEPTIGVVAGQDYYFIANSQGGVMRRAKGPLADEPLTEPAVLRIRLK